nr:hypothetical protein [Oscillospiraceae bacterium]
MKNITLKAVALSILFVMCLSFVGCFGNKEATLSTEVYEGDVIYVGNTAATTGAGATIGVPFNLGIEAAFAAYNAKGGFNGKTVALKHYDDMGDSAQAVTLMEKLIHEDEIFAVVGNYGTYAVAANIDILKENCVPMVYAAAGNNVLFNSNATSDGDRCIFPVQPLNQAEGQMLILRAFAPAYDSSENYLGGLGATKVGVISSSDEASQAMLSGIKAEAEKSGLSNIVYQNVTTDDYSAAASALQAEGCDVVIVTVVGAPFVSALTALANVNYNKSVLTTYNNANAAVFNDENSKMTETGLNILSKMTIYAQAWLDVNDLSYYYKADTNLYNGYKFLGKIAKDEAGNDLGVPGFTQKYWDVAEDIFDYAASLNDSKISPLNMSYNSYALAGYIAGNLFCQALDELKAQGKDLSRANLVDVLESKSFQVAMADQISYQNGLREGVQSFSLTVFYDTDTLTNDGNHTASSTTIHSLTSMDEYRALISK